MGIYDRQYYKEEQGGFGFGGGVNGKSIVFILIAINVAVFVADALLGNGLVGNGRASTFLTIYSQDALKPWMWFRFVTYGFAHGTPMHLFWNMFGLYIFGNAVESYLGPKKFLWFYLTALVFGSVSWMVAASAPFASQGGALLGASGGVAAVVILFCLKFPNQRVSMFFLPFIAFPAWVIGVFYVGGDLIGFLGNKDSNVAFLVHLAGAAYAYLFFRTGFVIGGGLPDFGGNPLKGLFKAKPNLRVHRPQPERKHDRLAEKADAILKKLHEQGEGSLTARERKILEDYSRSIKQKNV